MKSSARLPGLLLLATVSGYSQAGHGPVWVDSKEYKVLVDPKPFAKQPTAAASRLLQALQQRLNALSFDKTISGGFSANGRDTVRYYDSAGSCVLQAHAYSLRQRQGDDEDVEFKFRHGDEELSAATAVAAAGNQATEKLETDLSPAQLAYSHSSKFTTGTAPTSIQALIGQFPGATALQADHATPLVVVNDLRVEQQEYAGPSSDLGKSTAKFTLSLWYLPGQATPVLAELSFRIKANDQAYYSRPVLQRSQTLFRAISSLDGWSLAASTTKTGWVYAYQSAAYPNGFCTASGN